MMAATMTATTATMAVPMSVPTGAGAGIPTFPVSPWELLKSLPVWGRVRFAYHASRFLLDPDRTDQLFKVIQVFLETRTGGRNGLADYVHAVYDIPGVRALYDERYLPQAADLDALSLLPEGTLGKTFADHMRRNNLAVVFYPMVDVVDEVTYLTMRGRQIHDIMHVVTGFSTSIADELGLQAFEVAQINDPLASGIVGGGIMHASLKKPEIIYDCLVKTAHGFNMGRNARNMLAYKFEENWAKPLDEVRRELGLVA